MGQYSFLPELILRTPGKSFSSEITREFVLEMLNDNSFLEAIYLASPSLYQSIKDLKSSKGLSPNHREKVIFSCAKYLLRNRTRPTPFGLFSGNSVIKWGKTSKVEIAMDSFRKTRLDFSFLYDLTEKLNRHFILKKKLKYYPNGSYYFVRDEIRFLEYLNEDGKITYQISSLEKNEFILQVLDLAKTGATIDAIAESFVSDEITHDEAFEFVESLVECQLLWSELRLPLTRLESLDNLIEFLHQHGEIDEIAKLHNILEEAKIELDKIDHQGINSVANYENLINKIASETPLRFHSESFYKTKSESTISEDLQESILDVMSLLNDLNPPETQTGLSDFIEKFKRRYGDRTIPLLQALDPECGIGYGNNAENVQSPLIEGIEFEKPENSAATSEPEGNQKIVVDILKHATENSVYEIDLENYSFQKASRSPKLSPTTAVVFHLLSENQIYLEGIGGSSALNLINRFSFSSDRIYQLCEKISKVEAQNNPEVILAEILHLPETRLGNVLLRKVSRESEIPTLSHSIRKREEIISLRNLTISVFEDSVILKDISTNKIIVPKLSTAHNFDEQSMSIYRFLCDLQHQHIDRRLRFYWGKEQKDFSFLPRVTYRNVILSLATWKLEANRITELRKVKTPTVLKDWMLHEGIPITFVISEGDNNLFIDIENPFLCELFLEMAGRKERLILKEFLHDPAIPIRNSSGESMVNQLIGILVRNEPSHLEKENPLPIAKSSSILSSQPENSNWVYLKLYCGVGSVDKIFEQGIKEIVETGIKSNLIDSWFFIRYRDPDFHIRIRFQLSYTDKGSEFLAILRQYVQPLEADEYIWKSEFAQYEPEGERYAAIGIKNAERLFYSDSSMYLKFLDNVAFEERENVKWLFTVRAVDNWLEVFGLDILQKRALIERMRDNFAKEFGINQTYKRQLDNKYRSFRNDINFYLEGNSPLTENLLDSRAEAIKTIIPSWEKVSFNEDSSEYTCLSGIIHMTINRFMTRQPRLHELLIYDFLLRSYISYIARKTS